MDSNGLPLPLLPVRILSVLEEGTENRPQLKDELVVVAAAAESVEFEKWLGEGLQASEAAIKHVAGAREPLVASVGNETEKTRRHLMVREYLEQQFFRDLESP